MNRTPKANRIHIAIYGKRNAGKSTLINMITGQKAAIVSKEPGTTADPVYKSMELSPIGPVVFIDTAGYDDEGELGELRVQKTEDTLNRADVAILVLEGEMEEKDRSWARKMEALDLPYIIYRRGEPVEDLPGKIEEAISEEMVERKITEKVIGEGGFVMLVMPQDIQAPKGRLILPQVQTLRELLDRRCTAICTTIEDMDKTLERMAYPPELIITDSQCFREVYEKKPESSAVTSFSILFADYKGDLEKFRKGAEVLAELRLVRERDIRILIAEACNHIPKGEDIGRVKLPRALKKFFKEEGIEDNLKIEHVRGNDFPEMEELGQYDLVIHCGACMFNRKHVMSRIAAAERAGVPITNYGLVLDKLARREI